MDHIESILSPSLSNKQFLEYTATDTQLQISSKKMKVDYITTGPEQAQIYNIYTLVIYILTEIELQPFDDADRKEYQDLANLQQDCYKGLEPKIIIIIIIEVVKGIPQKNESKYQQLIINC